MLGKTVLHGKWRRWVRQSGFSRSSSYWSKPCLRCRWFGRLVSFFACSEPWSWHTGTLKFWSSRRLRSLFWRCSSGAVYLTWCLLRCNSTVHSAESLIQLDVRVARGSSGNSARWSWYSRGRIYTLVQLFSWTFWELRFRRFILGRRGAGFRGPKFGRCSSCHWEDRLVTLKESSSSWLQSTLSEWFGQSIREKPNRFRKR